MLVEGKAVGHAGDVIRHHAGTAPFSAHGLACLGRRTELRWQKADVMEKDVKQGCDDTGGLGYRFLEGRRFRVSCKVNF